MTRTTMWKKFGGQSLVLGALCLCLIGCGKKPDPAGAAGVGNPAAGGAVGGGQAASGGQASDGKGVSLPDNGAPARPRREVSKLKNAASVYQVSYTPETVLFSPASVASSLEKISDDGVTFTFNGSSEDAKKLHAGSVLLLTGVALRTVRDVSQTGGAIIATTTDAAITDAIAEGTIRSDMPFDFGSMQLAAGIPPTDHGRNDWSILPTAYAGEAPAVTSTPLALGPQKFTFTFSPFSYTIAFTPAPGQLNIDMTVTETTTNMGYTATGYIKNFHSLMNMVISNQKITELDFTNSGLESELKLTWSMASQMAGPMSKIGSWTEQLREHPQLKGLAFYCPFTIGPIPFTAKFTGGMTFIPAFTSKNTVMDGYLTFHYSGSAGLTVTRGSGSPAGTIVEPAAQDPVANVVSLGPLGFTVAVELPRMELGLGTNLWAVGSSSSFGIGTFSPAVYVSPVAAFGVVFGGPAAMMPCQTHTRAVSINVGVSAATTVFTLIGFGNPRVDGSATKLSMEKQIYKKVLTEPKPGMRLCPS